VDAHSLPLLSAQVFEPVVNVPALGSFLVSVVVFSLLQFRTMKVNEAVERRNEALAQLRSIKARELSSTDNRPSPELIQQALKGFEQAIENEESLRTIIPGIRIVAPDPSSEDEIRAAQQFLGLDLRKTESAVNEPGGLSAGAIGVLVLVGISQVALLYMLSFDPMKAQDVFSKL
jgi:hypothetical protein